MKCCSNFIYGFPEEAGDRTIEQNFGNLQYRNIQRHINVPLEFFFNVFFFGVNKTFNFSEISVCVFLRLPTWAPFQLCVVY